MLPHVEIPGTFVCLQGVSGDGIFNGMDPNYLPDDDDSSGDDDEVSLNNSSESPPVAVAVSPTPPPPPPPPITTTNHVDLIGQRPYSSTSSWKRECQNRALQQRQEWLENVGGNNSIATATTENHHHRPPPHYSLLMNPALLHAETPWWIDSEERCLTVFQQLPKYLVSPIMIPVVVSSGQRRRVIAPGTTIIAKRLITLNSQTYEPIGVVPPPIDNHENHHPDDSDLLQPRVGWMQILELDEEDEDDSNGNDTTSSFVVYSVDGYAYMAPGVPDLYCGGCNYQQQNNNTNWWRVTCLDGAFVRNGLDLSSPHVATLPYGSLVQIVQKTVNRMALTRLLIRSGSGTVSGWISEFLNPLSGQRGTIVRPLPFPVPALFRVVLPEGAVIRSDVELSSPIIGAAPLHAHVAVVGRAFSEHPKEKCLLRYRLVGGGEGGGWISSQLNKVPPLDKQVIEFVRVDGSFEPDDPERYHISALRSLRSQVLRSAPSPISSADDDEEEVVVDRGNDRVHDNGDDSSVESLSRHVATSCTYQNSTNYYHASRKQKQQKRTTNTTNDSNNNNNHDQRCLICLTEERTATIVHGETGHVACCLVCARILKARGDCCPVCRLPIDLVIQQFWA